MAAEVPAKDVLCEAMEYLSKLGSNLRTRSENLREKKIRRDKLNNVLAVQKAASKVLLICELSKKSLGNVETGVRKILDHINISQASSSDGGKTTKTVTKPDDTTKYYYIEYKSRKLRVKKRISLKHYTSVKVLAKRMPKSMIAKYPVHYDCKLYRLRQAGKKLRCIKNNSECESFAGFQREDLIHGKSYLDNVSEIKIPDSPTLKTFLGDKNIDNSKSDMSVISIPDTPDKSKSDRKWIDFDIFSGSIEETRPKSIEQSVKERRPSEKLKEKCDGEKPTKERSNSKDFNPSLKKNKANVVETLDNGSGKKKSVDHNKKRRNTSETSSKSDSNDGAKKTRKIKVVDVSSDDEKATDEGKEDIAVEKLEAVEGLDAKKTTNHKEIAEDSSDEEKPYNTDKKEAKVDENSKTAKDSDSEESSHEPKLKKRKISVSSSKARSEEANDEVALESSADDKNTETDKEQSEKTENEPVKPVIKCVSLSKLLKPDVLVKKDIQKAPTTSKNIILIGSKTKPKNNDKDRVTESLARKEKEEQEYWVQKRKEVKGFKSKSFVINVTRLPELSVDFLNNLNLRKVTQSGVTICEVVMEPSNDKGNKTTSKKKDSRSSSDAALDTRQPSLKNSDDNDQDLIAEANKVKNSLLFESDSDGDAIEGETQVLQSATKTINTVKNALLNDSDSENKNSDDGSDSVGKNKKDNDPIREAAQAEKAKRSDGSKSNSDTKEPDQGQKIKKTLLNDSDSDSKSKPSSDTAQAEELKKRLLVESDSDSEKNKTITEKGKGKSEKDKDNLSDSDSSVKSKEKCTGDKEGTKSNVDGPPSEKDDNSDGNKEDNNTLPEKTAENLSQTQKNENAPEKVSSQPESKDEKAKYSLLNNSSDDEINTPLSQRKTLQSKKKHVRETVNAKKMLIKHSSSDTEDKKLQNAVKEMKDSLSHKEKCTGDKEGTKSNVDNPPSEKDDNSDGNEDNNTLPEKTAENLSQTQKNENAPEKVSSQPDSKDEKAKYSLLNNSSDDEINTPLSQRKTSQSEKMHMRETVNAKKMLMKHSSSDTEDKKLQNAVKEIKDSLLHGSDEENSSKKREQNHKSGESSSSSDEDILKKVKKKTTYDSSSSIEKKVKRKRKKHRKRVQSDESDNGGSSNNSKSSSSKMVRSKSKPGNSSSQNSDALDASDKDIDGLTNLDSLNKPKSYLRHSNSSDEAEEGSSKTRSHKQKPKPSGLICEEMLKAESSSDASASCEEIQDNDDDLPEVTIPSFNGASELLVKDDLLGESESDSHNESANKDDKDESDEEEKLNARRKKANAISSDSEVGSSRKKDAGAKLSDFEDSDDSELTKRTKRKKKGSDSDASAGSTSPSEGGKKKRRRIKSVRDSDASGSESETEGRNKHGRKNIRKVMGKNQLEEATKKAAREEKERVARIAERQKMYNNLEFDESGKPDEVVLDKVVLDFDPETKEPLIEVDRGLVKKLKPHQANGIKFMWNACFESVKRIKKDKGSGCILAHCMGLGKTLQVVSLTHTLLIHSELTKVNRVLVVCPLSTVLNWVNEFRMWLEHAETEYEVDVYELSRYKQNSERAFQLSQWLKHGGVCVLGYEMFRNLSADNGKKFRKKMLKNFQEALVDPGPDLVVCDEGHLLKNEKTSLSQSMNRVKTLRRIVLTGTPLQNNLKEYYCMVQFVKPNLLGKYNEYLNRFVNPITNGQYTDSTEHDIKIMKRRSHVLHKMLDGAVQRRDYGVLAPFLPPKHEYVLFITLSEVQTKLYQHYLDNFSRRPLAGKSSGFLFPDFQSLQRIWTHPLVLKYNSERYEIMQQKKRDKEEEEDSEGSLVDFINDSSPEETSTEESSDDMSDVSDDSQKKSKKKKSSKKSKSKDKDKDTKGEGHSRPRRGTRANPIEILEDDVNDDVIMEAKNENPTEWWIKLVEDEELDDMRNSHKLVLLFDILRQCETIGDKLLVFSQSLYSLDLIEHFLGKVDEATQDGRVDEKLGGHVGSWSPGIDYFRLDGSTSCENRSIWCKNFNREDNPRARLFLISTRAGGLGINLVAANRVVIFDVSWNPSHDVQSIFRVYRFGQKKPCYVYRFLAMGTMEEKIYERQVTKQAISKRVIDEQQIDRHYAENDLAELYKFEPQPPTPRPLPPLPKDRLFAEMLREHDVQIYKYHEHDSLLENKEEETLSEEERKAAWEDFENEKNRPPPVPFQAPWPMHNGMVPSLLQQQQQQYAFAAVTAMLRKTMPNLNENQIRDMIPLIAAANPQMMQSMNEIYKYAQPGMMNPAMMSPDVMGGVGGGSMGLGAGGGSSLQYEPPWQRQQHQQQQMRLQQLMQQNSMGAKFYAGGLGSRDPVAMALQQQRAREIMLGAAAGGRPRGRPPLAPRAPPPDVVNLDSD